MDNLDTIASVEVTLEGVFDLLMHCGQTADPFNPFARAIKRLSGKRNKTDEQLMTLSNIEWWAGLYTSEPAVIDGNDQVSINPGAHIIMPAHVLESCVRGGARKSRMGKQTSAGAIVEGDGEFHHDGPKDINKLFLDNNYHSRKLVTVGQKRIVRVRPIFRHWQIKFKIQIDCGVIEPNAVKTALANAGKLVGIGDWRPGAPRGGSYGRFNVERFVEV